MRYLGKTEMLNIRISATLKRLLTKRAERKGQSLSDYVRSVLQNIDDYEEGVKEAVSVADLIQSLDEDDNELVPLVKQLKEHERRVLWELLNSIMEELPISQTAISKRCGVDQKYIRALRQNERFGKALSAFVFQGLRGYVDKIIGHLFRQSAEGKTMATILLLELTGMYNPVTRIMSVKAGVDAKDYRGLSADGMKREVVKEWKKMGWRREEFEQLWETTDNEAMKKGKMTRGV